MSSKYLDLENSLNLNEKEDILFQIEYRKIIKSKMLGKFHPSVLNVEINKLYDHLRNLGFEVNDEN